MEWEQYRDKKLQHDITRDNEKHFKVMESIKGKDPKLAAHMMQRNDIIRKFASKIGGGIDILEQPMCEHCEKPAAWDEGGTAYCFACNKKTSKPITVHEYFMEHTKYYTKEQLEILKALGGESDETGRKIIL